MKSDVNVPSKSNKQKNLRKQLFFVGVLKVNAEQYPDPDPLVPYQNVTEPQHWLFFILTFPKSVELIPSVPGTERRRMTRRGKRGRRRRRGSAATSGPPFWRMRPWLDRAWGQHSR